MLNKFHQIFHATDDCENKIDLDQNFVDDHYYIVDSNDINYNLLK